MTKKISERSRRPPGDGKRVYTVAVRFSESEWARVEARALAMGLVTAAYVGVAAVAMADQETAAGYAEREKLDKLTAATEQVARAVSALKQGVKTMRALSQVRPSVEFIAVRVGEKVEALDDALIAVAGPLLAKRIRRRR